MALPPDTTAPSGPRLNLPIFLLALFGVLVVVHLWVQAQANFAFGCTGVGDAASAGGCAAVTSSAYSTFLGISLLVWGGMFYLTLAALRFGIAAAKPPARETVRKVSFGVATAGFLFALYLVSVQFFQLQQFCVLCLVSSVTTAVIFAFHLVERARPGPAVALGAALRPYALAAVALVVLAGADLLIERDVPAEDIADGQPEVTAQQAVAAGGLSADCRYDVETPRIRTFDELITLETPYEGSADASVRVVKIFDPNCPHCKSLHQELERIIPQLEDKARFYYKPYPLPGWDHSVPQVQALYIAGEEGKFFDMLDLQFLAQRQGGLSLDDLAAAADRIGLDGETMRSEIEARKYIGLIEDDRELIGATGIRSVPKLIIEGNVLANTPGAWTAECIGGLIDLAAQEKAASTATSSAAPVPADS